MKKLCRFSPLTVNKKLFKNRVIVPPMASQTADNYGRVTPLTLNHYEALASSNAGLVMVEYSFVDSSGKSEHNQLGISSDDHLPGLINLSRLLKAKGQLAGIQLNHSGGKTERSMTGGVLKAPSRVSIPVKDLALEIPDEMNVEDINSWIKSFREAAIRAKEAGFDVIEIHAAHGYGLNQWISNITNKRNDQFGGSLLQRSTLLLDIVKQIRIDSPDVILAVRLPGQDFIQEGLTQSDTGQIASMLESAGVDIIDVSSGIGGWRRPDHRNGEGYLVSEAANIKKFVSCPVIGVGGIESGTYIDQILAEEKVSLAAVGRAILKDPVNWGHKHLKGV